MYDKLNKAIRMVDQAPLWWTGILFLVITFLPYVVLKEGSVFEIHDQLDETIMTYVLNARHLFDGSEIFPELLGGVNKSGMQPSAMLFIPLYRILPAFWAFVVQYLIVSAAGYWGMYACAKQLTGSSILSVAAAGCFALLPIQPIYGLSVFGVPMLLYAFLCLWKEEKTLRSFALILFFGLTTHLVLIGYVVLSFWALAVCWQLVHKKISRKVLGGFFFLTGIYVVVNYRLFLEFFLGNSAYISHREEHMNMGEAQGILKTIWRVFLNSFQHADAYHLYLILPIVLLLVWGAVRYRKYSFSAKTCYQWALGIFVVLIGIAVLYGICKSDWMAQWKNTQSGFLRYFQLERYYWLYPTLWYLDFALAFAVWWKEKQKKDLIVVKLLVLVLLLFPTLQYMKPHTYFYRNVNQYNNGSGITGYITWRAYYAEELMIQVEEAIGRDMSTYRVAHLGISPAPSLMHGFYTVDGYSNNYPLEYKHRFRQVIAKELEKNESTRLYFDQWGSRCYLFNGTSGTYWNMGKHEKVTYETLEFDTEALASLGCEYLFSGGEILCAEELGLTLKGYYETEDSYWGIWLYEL